MTPRTAIDPETVGGYLGERDVLSADGPINATPLGGGVSNTVLRVERGGECVIVKQPLPDLAVDDEWPADVSRVHNEAAAARAYRNIAGNETPERVRVPRVVFEDTANHVVGLECAPDASTTWKQRLLDGAVDVGVAETLGRFLGTAHETTAGDAALRERFASEAPFEQLRLDPYHATVARRHPDVAEAVEREIERVRGTKRALVHGDYSPKNVLVVDGDGADLWLIDFEVAHWGDPAFDTAFMLNHLLIKSVHLRGARADLLSAARSFWSSYRARAPWDVEAETVRELAVLMLARVDGKSPVEYVTDPSTKEALRATAKRALLTGIADLETYIALLEEETP